MKIWIKPDSIIFEKRHFAFKNKLAYLMLECLYKRSLSNQTLSFSELEKEIKKIKPQYSLTRIQSSRMVTEIERAISTLSLPIGLEYASRNKTVGPWFLSVDKNVVMNPTDMDIMLEQKIPNLFYLNDYQKQTEYLQEFLSYWVQSFSAFDLGLIEYALDKLDYCYQLPITPFTKCFIDLYKARLHTRKGEFSIAEKIIKEIINNPHISSQYHIVSFASIMLIRIKYEKNPATSFKHLLEVNIPPRKYYQEDILSLMEWHNIQSLLLKRKLFNIQQKDKINETHNQILYHLQEAIMMSMMLENRSRFLDYCSNYVLYLQTIIPLGLSTVKEVLAWYKLNSIFSNKLSVGDYSIWSDIFYTQFYLEYKNEIENLHLEDNIFGPEREEFYIHTLSKAKSCGNERQIIIFYLCYFEFACNSLAEDKVKEIANKIIFLLEKDIELFEEIKLEGYQKIINMAYQYKDNDLLIDYYIEASKQASKQASKRILGFL